MKVLIKASLSLFVVVMLFAITSCEKESKDKEMSLVQTDYNLDGIVGNLYIHKTSGQEVLIPNEITKKRKALPYNKSYEQDGQVTVCAHLGDKCFTKSTADGGGNYCSSKLKENYKDFFV